MRLTLKKITCFCYLFVTFLLISPLPQLMAQKKITQIGCIDVEFLLEKVRSDKVLTEILSKKKSSFLNEVKQLSQQIERLKQQLQTHSAKLSDTDKQRLKQNLLQQQEALRQIISQQKNALQNTAQDLSDEVIRHLYKTVKKVAIEKGYALILEKRTAIIYADPEVDITNEVILALKNQKDKFLNKKEKVNPTD